MFVGHLLVAGRLGGLKSYLMSEQVLNGCLWVTSKFCGSVGLIRLRHDWANYYLARERYLCLLWVIRLEVKPIMGQVRSAIVARYFVVVVDDCYCLLLAPQKPIEVVGC